jgi:2-oxoglutarate ferredoxin oxidoreductase subunit alpha
VEAQQDTSSMSVAAKTAEQRKQVTILFSGDSGDGMRLTGSQLTTTSAVLGNDVSTMPDYPSEIRAPAGSVAGVSGFQLHFSAEEVHTPGDNPDVLVAMNPAALKTTLPRLLPNGVLIIDQDAFSKRNLAKAGYDENPLRVDSDGDYQISLASI